MSKAFLLVLAGASALATTSHAAAGGNPTDAAPKTELQEIVVTARRQSEVLQNIPVSVQAVSGDALAKLAITQPSEISKLTPGLNINVFTPDDPSIILRGVRWNRATGPAAIPFYLNEIAFGPGDILKNVYDINQIEVVRGPQGTSRGAPSISGAVTVTTQKPDLNDFGGYVSGQVGEAEDFDAQGAVNIPLIPGKLALRVAGDYQNSEGNRVSDLNDRQRPNFNQFSGRVSLRYEPTDALKFLVMYQRTSTHSFLYDQVAGPGSPGVPGLGIPANFNGPAITPKQHLAVEQGGSDIEGNDNLLTFNASWAFHGQVLNYNLGWQHLDGGITFNPLDVGNLTPGFTPFQPQHPSENYGFWHELRLSSQRQQGNLVDYDVGVFYTNARGGSSFGSPAAYFPGAFGNPAVNPSPFITPIARYTLPLNFKLNIHSTDFSVYGNVNIHLPFDTELSGGVRKITDRTPFTLDLATGAANFGFTNPTGGAVPCEAFGGGVITSPVYGGGTCDQPIPGQALPRQVTDKTYSALIYNTSLSHKFTRNILGYATVGTSWRPGFPSTANFGLPVSLLYPKPETATSYEVGVKTTWGRRLRINADVFQIDYKGQLTQFANTPYFNTATGLPSATNIAFLWNVDAQVRGVEGEIAIAPVTGLTLAANVSYSTIESGGGTVPCNDPSRPITAGNIMNFCASAKGQNLNAGPAFQASLNGEYTHPLGSYDGYFRFNINEQGNNPNFGTSLTSTPAYTLVDLFAGITGERGRWDLGVYVKNVTNTQVVLTSSLITSGVDQLFGPPGYNKIDMNLPRELGMSARYKFQ